MSSSLYAGELDLGGEDAKRDEVGEAGRTSLGGGVSQGAGWQRVFMRAPSPHPTSRTCTLASILFKFDRIEQRLPYLCNPMFSQKVEYPYPSLEIKLWVESDSELCFANGVHSLMVIGPGRWLKDLTFCRYY